MMPYLIHLRLPFQFLLSPVFLWAYLLADGRADWTLAASYVSLHLFGYAGGTALNSSYDRDTGPIGALAFPPPVPPHLLAFSLLWQAAGLALALLVNPLFAGIYFVMFLLSLAYSHPRLRWKGRPLLALLTVMIGQGLLAFSAGWSAARGELFSALSGDGLAGVLTVVFLIIGLYPLTEIYQLDEDRARGDYTFAMFLGVRSSFQFAFGCILLGGLFALRVAASRFTLIEALLLVVFISLLLLALRRWRTLFDRQTILENYRSAMMVYAGTTLPMLAWIAFRLFIR